MKALALVALVLLAGCAAPQARFAPSPTTCTGASARWTEPGLYAALPAAAEQAHVSLLGNERPTTRLDVNASALDRYHERWLQSAEWLPPNSTGSFILSPWTPGEWQIVSQVAWENATLLADLHGFLSDLGLRDHPEEKAWERAIVASRGLGFPAIEIVATPDINGLIDRLDATGPPRDDPASVGTVALGWKDWRFTIEIGTHTIVVPTPSNQAYQLVVDEQDRVVAYVPLSRGEAPYPALQAQTNATFARLGLPPPTFQGVAANGGC